MLCLFVRNTGKRPVIVEPWPGERWVVFPELSPEERERLRQQALERADDSFMRALRDHLHKRSSNDR